MNHLFIDSDILIDFFCHRSPHDIWAAKLLTYAERNKLNICTSSLIVANVHYVTGRLNSVAVAHEAVIKLINVLPILAVEEKHIHAAIRSKFKDFEDAIQWQVAISSQVTHLITRNKKDFPKHPIIVCSAEEFLASSAQR